MSLGKRRVKPNTTVKGKKRGWKPVGMNPVRKRGKFVSRKT
jgi:hypothetical protein